MQHFDPALLAIRELLKLKKENVLKEFMKRLFFVGETKIFIKNVSITSESNNKLCYFTVVAVVIL